MGAKSWQSYNKTAKTLQVGRRPGSDGGKSVAHPQDLLYLCKAKLYGVGGWVGKDNDSSWRRSKSIVKYYPERPQDPANKFIMYSKISGGSVVLGCMIECMIEDPRSVSHRDGDIGESLWSRLSLHIGYHANTLQITVYLEYSQRRDLNEQKKNLKHKGNDYELVGVTFTAENFPPSSSSQE